MRKALAKKRTNDSNGLPCIFRGAWEFYWSMRSTNRELVSSVGFVLTLVLVALYYAPK